MVTLIFFYFFFLNTRMLLTHRLRFDNYSCYVSFLVVNYLVQTGAKHKDQETASWCARIVR